MIRTINEQSTIITYQLRLPTIKGTTQ